MASSLITTSTYEYVRETHGSSGSFSTTQAISDNAGQFLFASSGAQSNQSASFVAKIFDPNTSGASRKVYTEHFCSGSSLGGMAKSTTLVGNRNTGALTGIRFYNESSGSTITGTFHLYGIKNS